jgi:hypothetical protein
MGGGMGAPVITNFTATPMAGKAVQLVGTVTDAYPSSVRLSFTGVVAGSTTADDNGNFSYTANATGLGAVDAVGTDVQQLQSNQAEAQVAVAKPSLTLAVNHLDQNEVILSGTVTAASPGNLTVTFTGVVTSTTVTDANGNFSANVRASGVGTVQATVTDVWGQTSNAASATVSDNAPVILNFLATRVSGTTWTFTGTISDATPDGDTVTLGGLPSLVGKTVTSGADGSFSLTVTLQTGEDGFATAVCTDWFGLTSDKVQDLVSY